MSIVAALLAGILFLLFGIYRKIAALINSREETKEYLERYQNQLSNIFQVIYKSKDDLVAINYAVNWENPAGKNSFEARRFDNLVMLYAEYLVENKKMSKPDAEARANFEFRLFKTDELIEKINGTSIYTN